MKDAEQTKAALKLCPGDSLECEQELCPYWQDRLCVPDLHADVLDLLEYYEIHVDAFLKDAERTAKA